MKKITLAFLLFLFVLGKTYAQTDTTEVEQYCEMMATGKLFSTKVTIDIDFGESRKYWSDNRIKDETGKVKNFNTVVDAMNYMGAQGWKLATALFLGNGPYVYHYIFRREVPKSELKTD